MKRLARRVPALGGAAALALTLLSAAPAQAGNTTHSSPGGVINGTAPTSGGQTGPNP
jgi:hypothetical protein